MTQQSPTKQVNPSDVREQALVLLDRCLEIELRLSEDDSVYDLVYIGEKLTACSCALEELGGISMQLTRIALDVSSQLHNSKSLLNVKERQLKSEPAYVNAERSEKTPWLQDKLGVFKDGVEEWSLTYSYLDEIRVSVNDRIQLFKRLDSDIRLQHQLLEAKVRAGAMTPFGVPPGGGSSNGVGKGINEVDIS